MKDKKKELFLFSSWDRTGLETHLSRMAEKGWTVEKLTSSSLVYRRTEPKKLTFCVCYYPKASAFAPGPTEAQETFYDFCQHSGWTLAAEYAQLQIFYNEREDPVPIETDPVLEVETIHKAMKRSGLPAQLVLMALALVNGGLLVSSLLRDPVQQLASASNMVTGICWVLVVLLTGADVVSYCLWRSKAKKAAARGEFYRTTSRVWFQRLCLAAVAVCLVYYFLSIFTSGNRVMMAVAPLMFLWMALLFVIVRAIQNGLKRKKVSTGINRAVTMGSAFVLAYVMMGVIVFGMLYGMDHGWFAGDEDTYQYHGTTFTVYQDKLPLTVEDLLDVDYGDVYTREWRDDASLLLARYEAIQRPRYDAENYKDIPRLGYTITLVKVASLYDMCKNALLAEYDGTDEYWEDRAYAPIDAAPWGAVDAYRVVDSDHPWDIYLLCYPDRFIEFEPDWELTAKQMALVGETLGSK